MSVFRYLNFSKPTKAGDSQEDASIGILSIDQKGYITFCNESALVSLQDLTTNKRLPRQLEGKSLSDLLGYPLQDTFVGRTLLTGKELIGELLRYGNNLYVVTTKVIKDDTGEVVGCTQYTIHVHEQDSDDKLQTMRRFAKELACELGYDSTDWIDNISYQHAQLLTRCLSTARHAIPLTQYCPYKFQCAFSPQYGWALLDRRIYHRVPIEVPVEINLLTLPTGEPLPQRMQDKVIIGRTVNLSASGMQIQCTVKLPTHSKVRMFFSDSGTQQLAYEGAVIWQKQDNAGFWRVGIKFMPHNAKNMAETIKLINAEQRKLLNTSTQPKDRTSIFDPASEYAVGTIKNLLKAKSNSVFKHCIRTSFLTVRLGQALGLSHQKQKALELAATVHDIGKIEIDRGIIEKKGFLSSEEQMKMRQHPVYGAELLYSIPGLSQLAPIIRHHHEHYDGSGYPDGLKSTRIPLLSRILHVAGTIDAIVYRRQSQEPLRQQVLATLKKEIGNKFDPDIAETCIQLIESNKLLEDTQPARLKSTQ